MAKNSKKVEVKTKQENTQKSIKEKIFEIFSLENFKKYKWYILACLIVLILIIFVVIFLNVSSDKKKKEDQQALISSFESIGMDFYENFYYKQISEQEIQQFLKKYETVGIKVSLDNLSRYGTEENKQIINQLIEKCDKKETKIVIYPQEPYEQKSYRTETILKCDFEKE